MKLPRRKFLQSDRGRRRAAGHLTRCFGASLSVASGARRRFVGFAPGSAPDIVARLTGPRGYRIALANRS